MKSKLSGGGIIKDAFKATFGFFVANIVYFLIILIMIGILSGGVVMLNKAKDKLCKKYENKEVIVNKRDKNGIIRQVVKIEKKCVEESSLSNATLNTKLLYYAGIALILISAIIILVMIGPYIIQGFGYMIGFTIADNIF